VYDQFDHDNIEYVDRPRPGSTWSQVVGTVVIALIAALMVRTVFGEDSIAWVLIGGFITASLSVAVFLWSQWRTAYGWVPHGFVARNGSEVRVISFGDIADVEQTHADHKRVDDFTNRTADLLVIQLHSSDRGLIISPTDPDEMRAEILRRRASALRAARANETP